MLRSSTLLISASVLLLSACGQAETQTNSTASAAPVAETVSVDTSAISTPTPKPGSCETELGTETASELVRQCRLVTTNFRGPCNLASTCDEIRTEMATGCSFGSASEKLSFCAGIAEVREQQGSF